ncbi:hypothetical protein H0H92_003889 [Tricholoma furcatifolium]|nr:hypothetical protein H0H92_003889 [Tricholoma furcatifolium]
MTSLQIKSLLTPPNVLQANEKAVAFLDARFQSLDDLDGLETLVLDAQRRNDELQAKLSLSQSKIDTLLADTRVSTESYIHTAQELSLLRHSLTDELSELSQELISTLSEGDGKSTLLEDIETLHRNLKELQSVKGYVQVIEHALKLSENSAERIRKSKLSISTSSLSEYQALQAFVEKVREACSKVEEGFNNQTLNLVRFLENIREKAWSDIQGALSSSLNTHAEKIGWPTTVDYPSVSTEDRAAFEYAFRNLLKLQSWGEKNCIDQPSGNPRKNGLYPLQALVHPIALRFKFHFDGTRQTNRLDKPEWYFTHILNVVHDQRTFMESIIQRLLDSSDFSGINAWHEFTYLLLPILSRKLKHTMPSLLPHPSLLAHTIYQALIFDAALKDEGFLIQKTSATAERDFDGNWNGVSKVILGNAEWFEAWLQGEQSFAEEQYNDIIGASDAWLVAGADQDDEESQGDMKTTHSARRVCSLIEQVTDRYSPLPSFSHRTRFLVSVQLPILKQYHGRISASLDAFESLSFAFVRVVPGALGLGKEEGRVHVDNRGLTSGVEGVQRLCKALLSANYVERTMRGWAEELFFIELWAEINQNAELRGQAISNPLLPSPQTDNEIPHDTLFDQILAQYEHIATRAESMVVQQICGEVESLLKAHFSVSAPKGESPTDTSNDVALSQTLLAPIALLSSHLTFLRANMSQANLTTLYRRVASRLADHILHRQILYRSQFGVTESKSILAECELWAETCRMALGGGLSGGRARIDGPWTKLLQAARLASADGEAWTAVVDVTFGTQSDEAWDNVMTQAVGSLELEREEVVRILRRREDCSR